MQGYFTANKKKNIRGGGYRWVSTQDWHGGNLTEIKNLMLVITKSSGFVPHGRYIRYRIEKVGHGCRGGCLSPVAWEGQMVLIACNQNFMCLVIGTQSCTVL